MEVRKTGEGVERGGYTWRGKKAAKDGRKMVEG